MLESVRTKIEKYSKAWILASLFLWIICWILPQKDFISITTFGIPRPLGIFMNYYNIPAMGALMILASFIGRKKSLFFFGSFFLVSFWVVIGLLLSV